MSVTKCIVGSVVLLAPTLFIIRRYVLTKVCKCRRNFKPDDYIVITGATSGIGLSLATSLAKRGAPLILACRNIEKAESITEHLRNSTNNFRIHAKHLDLKSFDSISKFAKNINENFNSIYGLVNNGAIFYETPSLTVDNIEVTFQTNYLGPFLLTLLLQPSLRNHPGQSRIVNVSSLAHQMTQVYPQPEFHQVYEDNQNNRFSAYGYSKFCLVTFSLRLQELLQKERITVHCVDPGNCETPIFRNFPTLSNWWKYILLRPVRFFVVKTPDEGAQDILHCLLKSETPPFYVSNINDATLTINPNCSDPTYIDALWRKSRTMCKNYLTNSI